jgi:hypothetical protein
LQETRRTAEARGAKVLGEAVGEVGGEKVKSRNKSGRSQLAGEDIFLEKSRKKGRVRFEIPEII